MSDPKRALAAYWNDHVHQWKIAKHEVGTGPFFREIEVYRFEKLDYLDRRVDYAAFAQRRVLDVGCGMANDTARFAAHQAEVVGVDVSPVAIELAKKNFQQRNLRGEFHVMDGEALSFPEGTFDLVYCHTVLQFTPNPARMVREIHRVLKPGGRAFFMVINRYSWLRFMHVVFRVPIDYTDAPYFHTHTMAEFSALLAPFARHEYFRERYPVATRINEGPLAGAFNALFVPLAERIPLSFKQRLSHHLVAWVEK